MELDIDLPKYIYNNPYGSYSDDFLKSRDEAVEGLKKDSIQFKDALKYFTQYRPLKGEVWFLSGNQPIKGELKFVPKKFSVVDSAGRLHKALTCDIIIKNMTLMGNDDIDAWKKFFSSGEEDRTALVIKKQLWDVDKWEREFNKTARLIGMGDYSLRINDIFFEYDERRI
jgi:hypothetical protein